ncbi:MAG: threonine--tRNA ligase [Patescibacteria group bacterium]|nr:threonine--tRNA ligase [Patescibacteria group bacterium]
MSKILDEKMEKLPAKERELLALRHTAEHVLHTAMQNLYPKLKKAMGPATDEGFYFDFDLDEKISERDFPKIEKEMKKLIEADLPVKQEFVDVIKASEIFKNNPYKLDWLDQIEQRREKVSIYKIGNVDLDLCSGPHVSSTGKVKAFKLLTVAGAYWHGDEKNKMLTRIYGTAFESQKELDEYLHLLEESKKRDHKKLGVELDLFTFSDLVGAGLPLWTPKGTILRDQLDNFVWELRREHGYQKVEIPHITKKDLYEKSGHWDKFEDELFKINTREGHVFAMKPMNCPHHTQIYNHVKRSYRDLPQRYANTTMVYRDEQTGELSGLSRVRCITQDDAHVFCRKSQIKEEIYKIWDIVERFYSAAGFELKLRVSLHDSAHMEKYLGNENSWKDAESILIDTAKSKGIEFFEAPGEAAFYGPKLDFMSRDSLGREWQLATIQLDYNMPERFDLTCVGEEGKDERIIMIHAAIMGSVERYLSILIEHFAGAFPVWLSPIQVKVIPVTDKVLDYATAVNQRLQDQVLRSGLDDRNEKLGAKIRDAQLQKIPYMIIIGQKEQESNKISLRLRDERDEGQMSLDDFIQAAKNRILTRELDLW